MKALFFGLALVFAAACGDDDNNTPIDAPPGTDIDAPMMIIDASIDSAPTPDADCFMNPTTHNEIINGCTTAQKIYATRGTPPLTLPDGGLPDLPPP